MSEQRDDTTERDKPSPKEPARQPGSYYYDDGTGYEIYDPAKDENNEEAEEGDGDETPNDEFKACTLDPSLGVSSVNHQPRSIPQADSL